MTDTKPDRLAVGTSAQRLLTLQYSAVSGGSAIINIVNAISEVRR